jgi:hypothetical protein
LECYYQYLGFFHSPCDKGERNNGGGPDGLSRSP